MTVDIGDAFTEGWDRLTTETGGLLLVVYAAFGLLSAVVSNSLQQELYTPTGTVDQGIPGTTPEAFTGFPGMGGSYPLAVIDLPVAILLVIAIGMSLVGVVIKVGAIRWFVEADPTSSLDQKLFTRRLLWTVGNLIVGGAIYYVAVALGSILIVPGIFLAVTLFFYNYEIIVEGENAIEALENSWHMTKGDRTELFFIGLIFFALSLVILLPLFILMFVVPTAGAVLNSLVSTVFGVFGIAVAAAAYKQVRGSQEPEPPESQDVGAPGGHTV